jgi:hypothetical protein
MGDRYLTDLADVCRRTGWPVIEVDGWQRRARGSGGYAAGKPDHVMIHHTASGPSSDGWDDVNYCTFGDDDAPLCNLYLSRVPEIFVCAGGATNTNGSGSDPCHWIADDTMNSSAIGIEAGNDGVGEPWPEAQQAAYVDLVAELDAAYGIGAAQCHAHFEWTSRKVDCAGPSRWATSGSWDMAGFRGNVVGGTPPPEPTPEPTGDPDMLALDLGTPGTDPWWTRLTYTGSEICHVVSPADQLQARGGVPIVAVTEPELSALLDSVTAIGPSPFGPAGQAPNSALDIKWTQARGRT